MPSPTRIETFQHKSRRELTAEYQDTLVVIPDAVTCDVYTHPETKRRDLGIVRVEPGCNTPAQKVLKGRVTIEGYFSGSGRLIIIHEDGSRDEFEVDEDSEGFSQGVYPGEIMQWQAGPQGLQFFEVCFPPWDDQRFKDLSNDPL